MDACKDLASMIQVLTAAITIQEKEASFFRFSAEMAESKVARSLLLEMADDFAHHSEILEERKRRLQKIMQELRKMNLDVCGIDEREFVDLVSDNEIKIAKN